jgi:hypothetical protein
VHPGFDLPELSKFRKSPHMGMLAGMTFQTNGPQVLLGVIGLVAVEVMHMQVFLQ